MRKSRMKKTLIAAAFGLLAAGLAQAQVSVATFIELDNSIVDTNTPINYLFSDLNTSVKVSVPELGTDSQATVTGSLSGAPNFVGGDEFTLSFGAFFTYDQTAFNDSIVADTVNAYLDGLIPVRVDWNQGGLGINARTTNGVAIIAGDPIYDAKSTGISAQEAMIVEVDLSGLTTTNEITLSQLLIRQNSTTPIDVYIVTPDGGVTTVIQNLASGTNPYNLNGSWTLKHGDKVIMACPSTTYSSTQWNRFMGLTVDAAAEVPEVVVPPVLDSVAGNEVVTVSWPTQSHPAYAGVQLEVSTNGVDFAVLATVPKTTNAVDNYVNTGLINGVTYSYRGRALSNATYTAYSSIIEEVPLMPAPLNFDKGSTVRDSQNYLKWSGTQAPNFASFKIYRSMTSVVTTADLLVEIPVAATSNYTDNAVYNEFEYFYAISQVDTNGSESALSEVVLAFASSDAVVVEKKNSYQGGYYIEDDELDGTFNSGAGGNVQNQWLRVGTRAFASPDRWFRSVLKFPIDTVSTSPNSTLGGKTSADIVQAVLKIYVDDPRLTHGYTNFEVYTSTNNPDASNAESDFTDPTFALADADNSGLFSTNSASGWYEFDVTKEIQDAFAAEGIANGIVFRLQLENDANIPTNVLSSLGCVDNLGGSQSNPEFPLDKIPQLRIRFELPDPDYGNWEFQYDLGSNSETNDYDNDGVNNLIEYALAGNPTSTVVDTQVELLSGSSLNLVVPYLVNDTVTYSIEIKDDLVNGGAWTNVGYTAAVGTGSLDDNYDLITNNIPTTDAKKYIRIKVSK